MICNVPAGFPCDYCDGKACVKCENSNPRINARYCPGHTFAERHGRRNRKRPRARKKPVRKPTCSDGGTLHVFCLGASKCSCCGFDRYAS